MRRSATYQQQYNYHVAFILLFGLLGFHKNFPPIKLFDLQDFNQHFLQEVFTKIFLWQIRQMYVVQSQLFSS